MSPEYEACVRTIFYHKKGKKVENEFKAGDLVFEVSDIEGVNLTEVTTFDNQTYSLKGNSGVYTANGQGFDSFKSVPSLFHTTPENRQALVTLYGEDAVPEIPLRGSELTKKLLEKQKYVICRVSETSDDRARDWAHLICVVCAVEDDGFTLGNGGFTRHAVPIDNNGDEITEIESC